MPIKTNVALFICLLGLNCSSTKKAEKIKRAEGNRNQFNCDKNLYKYIASNIDSGYFMDYHNTLIFINLQSVDKYFTNTIVFK
jgi:predicted peroxiredoxin